MDRDEEFILRFAIRYYKFVSRSCTFLSLEPIQLANNPPPPPALSTVHCFFFKMCFKITNSIKNKFVMLLYEMGSMDVKWIIFVSTFIYWL